MRCVGVPDAMRCTPREKRWLVTVSLRSSNSAFGLPGMC